MPITGIWLDFRLKELLIEFKNVRIAVRMRMIWSSEVEYTRSHTISSIQANSVPEGCRSILATP